jgi:hypothetical protein
MINSVFSLALIVQLPGAPAANNAKNVTHSSTTSTFTWSLSSATATTLQASTTYVGNQANVKLANALTPVASASTSSSSGSGGSGWSGGMIALVAGGAVIVLGAGALFIVRRRQAGVALQAASVSEAD